MPRRRLKGREKRLHPLKKWVLPTLMILTIVLTLFAAAFLPVLLIQLPIAACSMVAAIYQTLVERQQHRFKYLAEHIAQLETAARDTTWLDRLINPGMYIAKPPPGRDNIVRKGGGPRLFQRTSGYQPRGPAIDPNTVFVPQQTASAVQPPKGYDTIDWVNKFSAGVTMSQAAQALSQLAKPGGPSSDKPLIGKPVSHISCPECKAHSMLEVPSENMYYCMACHWYINWANGRRGTSLRTVSIEGEHGPELLQTHPRMWLRKGDRQIDVPYSCPACGRGSNWAVMPFGELRVTCIYCHVEFSYEVLRDMEEEVSRRAFRDSNFDWSNRTMK